MIRKLKDMTIEEIDESMRRIYDDIESLEYREFMADSYTEKAIIREDIRSLKNMIIIHNLYKDDKK